MVCKRSLLISSLVFLAQVLAQQNSIPIATSPVVVTTTIPTFVESLTTSLSVSTSVSNGDTVITATATDSDGNTSIFVSTATGAGAQARFLVTVTDVETIQVSTNTVIVSTIGSTTIFGPDTAATSTLPTATPPPITSTLITSISPSSSTVIVSQLPSTSSNPTSSSSSSSSTTSTIASPTPSLTSNTPSSSSSGKSLSTAAKAGIAIACIVAFAIISFVIWFVIRRRIEKENDPYMPSPGEKKRNKADKFVYDPEDTSYLDSPYREMPGSSPPVGGGVGGQRYEMQDNANANANAGTNRFGGTLGGGPRRPVRPGPADTAELGADGGVHESDAVGARRPGWRRGPFEKG